MIWEQQKQAQHIWNIIPLTWWFQMFLCLLWFINHIYISYLAGFHSHTTAEGHKHMSSMDLPCPKLLLGKMIGVTDFTHLSFV